MASTCPSRFAQFAHSKLARGPIAGRESTPTPRNGELSPSPERPEELLNRSPLHGRGRRAPRAVALEGGVQLRDVALDRERARLRAVAARHVARRGEAVALALEAREFLREPVRAHRDRAALDLIAEALEHRGLRLRVRFPLVRAAHRERVRSPPD